MSETRVIIRAFGDEPVVMEVVEIHHGRHVVRRPSGNGATISLPDSAIYQFTKKRFKELLKAFRSGDRHRLAAIWYTTPGHSTEHTPTISAVTTMTQIKEREAVTGWPSVGMACEILSCGGTLCIVKDKNDCDMFACSNYPDSCDEAFYTAEQCDASLIAHDAKNPADRERFFQARGFYRDEKDPAVRDRENRKRGYPTSEARE